MLKSLEDFARPDPLLVVAIALVDADGRVLVAQRPAGKHHAGLWEFPGGKVDAGETPEAALIREVAEELDVSISTACIAPATFASVASAEEGPLVLLLYLCRKWQGTPRAIAAAALRWVRPLDMHALAMAPADRSMIGLIEALL
jgi:8-oxo-dGTP diphosphatase